MAMGLVTEEDFEHQFNNTTPKVITKEEIKEGVIIEQEKPGRKEGDNNVPESARNLIGMTANVEGRKEALTLAKLMGISNSSASAYAKGSTSTASYNEPKSSIKDIISKGRRRASKKALNVLTKSLDGISDDKLNSLDAKELASVAKDMAAVVRHMEPEDGSKQGPLVQFQLFAPGLTNEDSYDRIQVSE